MKRLLTMVAFAATLSACQQNVLKTGVVKENFDESVRPQDDFYQYACGGWMKNNPLPAAYSRYGSFDVLRKEATEKVNAILKELQEGQYDKGTNEQKLSDLYKLAMDSVKRNADGVAPVKPWIDKLEAAQTVDDLFQVQLELAPLGDSEFFSAGLGADEKNATQNILQVSQGGITLGDKDYYLDSDSATAAIREAYRRHIVNMFRLFGFDEATAEQKRNNILNLETQLAKASRSRTELRDPERNYNKTTLSEFQKQYPNLRLEQVMNASGLKSEYMQQLIVGQPEFLVAVNKLLGGIKADEYRDYMEWGVIGSAAGYLSDETEAEDFDFYGRIMNGTKENHPLWRRATDQLENFMGQALGRMYVERYFPASSKERMVQLVQNLQKALGQRIEAQTWMADSTKQNALDKLATFYVKVGYPDKWIDMTNLNVDPDKSYYENVLECRRFWQAYEIDHMAGKPVDKDDWYMFPQTVNAYYNPTTNEICFPAGILQPPFFDPEADDAFNYGAIGVVIGHEMTHGFDDQGRQYDKDGNMHDWWTQADGDNFKERTDRYADYFSTLETVPGLTLNGRLTLGENLADHGGLQVAFAALVNSMKQQPLQDADGFTPAQRFFLAYAGVWAQNITEENARQLQKIDPHSPGRWRVNGALPHIDAFYEAFDVKEGDKMFLPKKERLDLW